MDLYLMDTLSQYQKMFELQKFFFLQSLLLYLKQKHILIIFHLSIYRTRIILYPSKAKDIMSCFYASKKIKVKATPDALPLFTGKNTGYSL